MQGSERYRRKVFKFGHGHTLQIADTPTDLWEESAGLYPFQSSPVKLFLSSSDPADVGIPIQLEGLNQNGIITRQVAVLNGQTQVPLPGLWWRQYRAVNADHGLNFAGEVYIAEEDTLSAGRPVTTSKIKIHIEAVFQQTQMLVYTTPRDWESEMDHVFVSLIPKTSSLVFARLGLYMRIPGSSWTNQAYLGLITSGTSAIYWPHLELAGTIQPFTDIVVRAMDISTNGMEITGAFSLKFTRKVL